MKTTPGGSEITCDGPWSEQGPPTATLKRAGVVCPTEQNSHGGRARRSWAGTGIQTPRWCQEVGLVLAIPPAPQSQHIRVGMSTVTPVWKYSLLSIYYVPRTVQGTQGDLSHCSIQKTTPLAGPSPLPHVALSLPGQGPQRHGPHTA